MLRSSHFGSFLTTLLVRALDILDSDALRCYPKSLKSFALALPANAAIISDVCILATDAMAS